MRHLIAIFMVSLLAAGCSKPTDIVFGPEPFRQMNEQRDQFMKLPVEDRVLLSSYLTMCGLHKAAGIEIKPTAGRTVGEVLKDARIWRERVNAILWASKKT